MAHTENDGAFVAVHLTETVLCWKELVLLWELRRSTCNSLGSFSWGTMVGKLWPLFFFFFCSDLLARHFHLDIFQAFQCEHGWKWTYPIPNLLFRCFWCFSEWSRGLGLALCFPPLPIPRSADCNTIYIFKSSLHHPYHFPSPEPIVSNFSQLLQKLSIWSPLLQSCCL